MATACAHIHKPHYSNGLCQNCYLAQYYLKRKKKNQEKMAAAQKLNEQKKEQKFSKIDNLEEGPTPKR